MNLVRNSKTYLCTTTVVGPFVSEKVFLSSPSLLQTPKHVSQTRFNAKIDKVLTDVGVANETSMN